jgi:hypothetical protein
MQYGIPLLSTPQSSLMRAERRDVLVEPRARLRRHVEDAKDRRPALDGTRAAVAEWLGVEPDAFEVETG